MFFAILALGLVFITACSDDDAVINVISYAQLPALSQQFLNIHFPDVEVVLVEKETEGSEVEYRVYLANGFKIEFEKNGAWDEIVGYTSFPQSILDLLPAGIENHVSTIFPNSQIILISCPDEDFHGYEIGLMTQVLLKFSITGHFVGYGKWEN